MGRVSRRSERQLMLDLAAHLAGISAPPRCEHAWEVQTALAIADGAPIGGDFIVFDSAVAAERLRAVAVDASGKGADAATRSIMLAGAISGLLGEVPADALLPAVNRHILRLGWEEHFATAVHLDVDLRTGDYLIGVAGHPAPAHFAAGSGRWRHLPATGPALGLLADVQWEHHTGQMLPGDVMLVVTDGVVETPGQDLDLGLDRLLGHAEALVPSQFRNAAHELLRQRRNVGRDDAQVLVLQRGQRAMMSPIPTQQPHLAGLRQPPVPYPGGPGDVAVRAREDPVR